MLSSAKVMIVEDEPVIRRGLQLFVENRGIPVLAECDNGEDAISLASSLHPDVVLMDIRLNGMDGITAARAIKEKSPEIRVLMLTSSDSEDDIFASFNAGADGYVLKTAYASSLELAIQTVSCGTVWLDPLIAQKVLHFALQAVPAHEPDALSGQEKLTLQGVADSNCIDGACMVQADFLDKLKRFRMQASAG